MLTSQCRAYHAGQRYYVEVDIVMDEEAPLKTTHDVSQALQRKLEGTLAAASSATDAPGLADVERAYVHVDYEDEHDIKEEHKPVHDATEQRSLRQRVKEIVGKKAD